MIIGVGCDVVEHNMTRLLEWESDKELLERYFSVKELQIYNIQKTTKFLAGRFAVKEAVLKCLGTGMYDGIALNEIEVLKDKFGKPDTILSGELRKISEEMGITKWHTSISHSMSYSVAVVVAE